MADALHHRPVVDQVVPHLVDCACTGPDDRAADHGADHARRARAGAERPGGGADEADDGGPDDDRDDEDDRDRQDDLEHALPARLDLGGSLVGLPVDVGIELAKRAPQPIFEARRLWVAS